MIDDVTVCIPTIPPRKQKLQRAVRSVLEQTYTVRAIYVESDTRHEGAAETRQRALQRVTTPWVAFLDDDDEFGMEHIAKLMKCALETHSDYVFPWFTVLDHAGMERPEWDPFPMHFGKEYDTANPHQTTISVLVKTDLAQEIGFIPPPSGMLINGQVWGEDWQFTLGCINAGGRITHLPERTWFWRHDGENTSGRPDRW